MIKFDTYEKELLQLEEKGYIRPTKPSSEEQKALMSAAKQSLQNDKRINIRISNRDLDTLKKKAILAGVPYQTFISSILHQYISGEIDVEQEGAAQQSFRHSHAKAGSPN